MYQVKNFNSRQALEVQLADQVEAQLAKAIDEKGWASIALSGGSTPKAFFNELSKRNIHWGQVTITLADDRWVDSNHDASNAKLIRENLLVNNASQAKFFSLHQTEVFDENVLMQLERSCQQFLPFDVLILGMGEDGHTASIFPCSDELEDCLAMDAPLSVNKVIPKTAPFERITFNFKALSQSKQVYMHICGDSKKSVLEKAMSESSQQAIKEMPIRAFLHHESLMTQVYWAQ